MRTTNKKIRIALAGGGTGGHIVPLVAVTESLQEYLKQGYDIEFHYFGKRDMFSEEILKQGAHFHRIAVGKWRRYFSLQNFLDIPKVAWSLLESLWKLYWLMPEALFSKGGPGAIPVVVAAWFYRIPVVIHESDAVPGMTNLISAFFARRIGIGFETSAKYFSAKKVFLTGNPVRPSLIAGRIDGSAAKERLGFNPAKPLIFVSGGSQGAQAINELILLNLKELLPITQVYHQTGVNNFADVEDLAKAALLDIPVEVEAQSRYKCVAYLDEDKNGLALSAADLAVGRAGAAYMSEFVAFGKPSILIPLEGHQTDNAYAAAEAGFSRVIEQENLTSTIFMNEVKGLLSNSEAMERMSAAAAKFYRPDAAKAIAAEILGLC